MPNLWRDNPSHEYQLYADEQYSYTINLSNDANSHHPDLKIFDENGTLVASGIEGSMLYKKTGQQLNRYSDEYLIFNPSESGLYSVVVDAAYNIQEYKGINYQLEMYASPNDTAGSTGGGGAGNTDAVFSDAKIFGDYIVGRELFPSIEFSDLDGTTDAKPYTIVGSNAEPVYRIYSSDDDFQTFSDLGVLSKWPEQQGYLLKDLTLENLLDFLLSLGMISGILKPQKFIHFQNMWSPPI